MIITKYTVVNFILLSTCLTVCFLLFSLENKQTSIRPPIYKRFYVNSYKLFDLNFKYLLNNNVCDSSDILTIIIVTSYYGNIETRSAMRRAFSNEKLREMKIRRVFLLALGPEDSKYVSYKAILNENERFGDLIQGNFKEAYRNLTYKHVMGLKWASTYCRKAKYIIKMDDDIVVNMHKLLNIMNSLPYQNNFLAGYILNNMIPIREPANKWYVTKLEYTDSIYPAFVSGWFYVTTPKTAENLVKLSESTPYFWIDDVYVTGILSEKLKMTHYRLNQIFAVHFEYLQCCLQDTEKYNYDCDLVVGPNGGDNNFFYTFNKIMSKCSTNKCISRPKNKNINDTCVAERKILIGKGKALVENVKLF